MSGQPQSDDHKAEPDSPKGPVAPETGEPKAAAPEAPAAPEPAPGADQQLDELKTQIADLTDRLLRAHADMDNIRKRGEREKAETAKYAISKFAGDVITVADNFRRAVSAVPAGAAEGNDTFKALLDGVQMTEREFLNALERNGVRRIDPKGEIFNPHLHQAVMEQTNPEVPSGTIVQAFEPGYVIDERVLRPAMVMVAKGGPKPNNNNGASNGSAPEGQSREPDADPAKSGSDEASRPSEAEGGGKSSA